MGCGDWVGGIRVWFGKGFWNPYEVHKTFVNNETLLSTGQVYLLPHLIDLLCIEHFDILRSSSSRTI